MVDTDTIHKVNSALFSGLGTRLSRNNKILLLTQDKHGHTSLMAACDKGFVTTAALLIEKGAVINYQNKVTS